MRTLLCAVTLLLSGCVTTLDPNYALQLQAYQEAQRAQVAVAQARADVETQRYLSIARIAESTDGQAKIMGVLALALAGGGNAAAVMQAQPVPVAPESQQDKAYKWAALFAGPVVSVAQGYFGYRTSQSQTNSQRDISLASYNALGSLGIAGFNSNASIATAGFGTAQGIATAGFNALGNRPTPVLPNITINGDGVIGNGTFTGPNSGSNSGNSGRINSPNDDHRTVTCTPSVETPC
jgi:hypothetical protein